MPRSAAPGGRREHGCMGDAMQCGSRGRMQCTRWARECGRGTARSAPPAQRVAGGCVDAAIVPIPRRQLAQGAARQHSCRHRGLADVGCIIQLVFRKLHKPIPAAGQRRETAGGWSGGVVRGTPSQLPCSCRELPGLPAADTTAGSPHRRPVGQEPACSASRRRDDGSETVSARHQHGWRQGHGPGPGINHVGRVQVNTKRRPIDQQPASREHVTVPCIIGLDAGNLQASLDGLRRSRCAAPAH